MGVAADGYGVAGWLGVLRCAVRRGWMFVWRASLPGCRSSGAGELLEVRPVPAEVASATSDDALVRSGSALNAVRSWKVGEKVMGRYRLKRDCRPRPFHVPTIGAGAAVAR